MARTGAAVGPLRDIAVARLINRLSGGAVIAFWDVPLLDVITVETALAMDNARPDPRPPDPPRAAQAKADYRNMIRPR